MVALLLSELSARSINLSYLRFFFLDLRFDSFNLSNYASTARVQYYQERIIVLACKVFVADIASHFI